MTVILLSPSFRYFAKWGSVILNNVTKFSNLTMTEKDIYLGLCWVKTWAFISLYCRKSRLNNEDELAAILENTTALINETIAPVLLWSRRLDSAQWSLVKEASWGRQLCMMVKSIRSCEVPLGSVVFLVPGGRQLSWPTASLWEVNVILHEKTFI